MCSAFHTREENCRNIFELLPSGSSLMAVRCRGVMATRLRSTERSKVNGMASTT